MNASLRNISFEEVRFSYENEPVLASFNWKARSGEHLVLKGASGSGKSTVLRLLLGFLTPSAGEIRIQTVEGTVLDPVEFRSHVAWLPQEPDFGDGTVEEVVDRLFSFDRNQDGEPDEDTVHAVRTTLDLPEDLLSRSVARLSTGQRQRVGVLICSLLDRPALLLDEPTSALDPENKERVADLLLGDSDRITISTSHDPAWVERATSTVEVPDGDH